MSSLSERLVIKASNKLIKDAFAAIDDIQKQSKQLQKEAKAKGINISSYSNKELLDKDMAKSVVYSNGLNTNYSSQVLKNNSNVDAHKEIINTRCQSCGAPLTGFIGDKVQCEYCDTIQVLSK